MPSRADCLALYCSLDRMISPLPASRLKWNCPLLAFFRWNLLAMARPPWVKSAKRSRRWPAQRHNRSAGIELALQAVTEGLDQRLTRTAAAQRQAERCLVAEGGGQQYLEPALVHPVLGVVFRQVADVGAGQDQDQLRLHRLHRRRAVFEAVAGQLALAPVATSDHALLGDHLGGNLALAVQRVAVAAVQPVLLVIQRLIAETVHARGE